MRAVRASSAGDLTQGLDRPRDGSNRTTELDAALALLEQWFRELPPDRSPEPEMTFPEFVRLLRDALRTSATPD